MTYERFTKAAGDNLVEPCTEYVAVESALKYF